VRLLYVATTRARELLVVPVVGDERDDKAAAPGWLDALDPVLYPPERRGGTAAPGCPMFGEDTVLERTDQASRSTGSSVRPGLHRPATGAHTVVFWDPAALDLDREDDAGQRQQKILAVDDRGVVAKEGIEQHAAWRRGQDAAIARGARPSLVVRTVTEAKTDGRPPASHPVTVETTSRERATRPHGKRFGILVHAVLATVPLDGDEAAIADAARIQARILGSTVEEATAARDAVALALAHPLLARARAAARVERETALMLREDDGTILEGVVDLAFLEEGAGWTVVDFKTDRDLALRKEDYARQLDAYARALTAATGEPARGTLLAV
jgi:ATP-dependent exoDNAse (exonuclease V) beta subunit